MIERIVYTIFIILIASSVFLSCANEVRPTGGPRDTIPPLLVHSVPATQSTNFKGNTLVLEFNEFIKTDKLNTQLLITPTVNSNYKVRAGSRRLQIIFDEAEPFEPNTTYTFNFQNSIKDITEGNSWQNPKIVFSTGDYLDSLSISGQVNDLLTRRPIKNSVVSIYRTNDTLDALTGKPMYFTVSDDSGKFVLENLISSEFKIYSFNDKNNNLIIDANNESYGFLPEPINLTESVSGILLNHVTLNITDLRLISARPIRHYFDISFNKNLTDFSLEPITEDFTIHSNLVDQNRKIRIYDTFTDLDSVQVKLTAIDSINNIVQDTLFIKFQNSTLPPEKLTQSMIPQNKREVPSNFSGTITFNKPIIKINYDSIFFSYDSASFEHVTPDDLSFNDQRDKVHITKKLNVPSKENPVSFDFYAAPGSFISADNDENQVISHNYRLLNPVNFGTIMGSINTENKSFIIQLLNTNFNVEMEIKNQKNFRFINVPPGNYHLRILVDEDNDGKWDPGNILKNKPPEPVVFYVDQQGKLQTVSIKANWELTDITIDIP
jgi:hypothetical protein